MLHANCSPPVRGASPDAVISISREGRVLFLNSVAERLFQYAANDIVGREITALMSEADRRSASLAIQRYVSTGEMRKRGTSWEVWGRRSDGTVFPARLSVAEVDQGGNRVLTGILRELSELPHDEQRINAGNSSLAPLEQATAAKSNGLQGACNEVDRPRAALRASDKSKADFLSSVSHELRTPLTAMLGYAELILDEPRSADVAGFAERIRDNGRVLLQLVDDLLELSRIESGTAEVVIEPFAPAAILVDVLDSFQSEIQTRGLTLDRFIGPEVPATVESDPGKFRKVLWNLVSNATKFTSAGGILVRMLLDPLPDPPQLRVDVVDTGCGIPADRLPALLQAFPQVNESPSRNYGGTGLGLALCRHYCEMLGGTIEVSSVPDRGTTFSCWFSFTNPSAEVTVPLERGTLQPVPALGLDGRNILLVEDNPANLYLLSRMVTKSGATVRGAANGLLAVEAVGQAQDRNEIIDAILLDMQMPVMDGYTAAHEIRKLGYTGPIVAVTADTTDRARGNSLAAGCDAYLTKPVSRRELVNTLQRLLLLKQHRDSTLDQPLMWE